jgi:hypothetical protein
MSTRIVGVHGIGNLQHGLTPADATKTLSSRWTKALRRGLGQDSRIEAEVAYYAHLLASDVPQSAPDPEDLDEPEQQMLLLWAAALGAPLEVTQGRLATPARQSADWIARKVGLDHAIVRLLVTAFCREVHLYLSDSSRRDTVRDKVADTIDAHHATVVIAHSLGSVIAYEALWARPALQIELLITLGSPLALPNVVFDKLDPAPGGKGHRPPGARRWINVADPGDFIAIPRGLATYFDGIDADLVTPIGVFNTHKVIGYLACPTTAAALATVLGRGLPSPLSSTNLSRYRNESPS